MGIDNTFQKLLHTRDDPYAQSSGLTWRARVRVIMVWLFTILAGTAILSAPLALSGQVLLRVGDVAPLDVTAPREVTYASDLLTQQRRDLAANAVLPVYDAPQMRVGRQQLTLSNQILSYIGSVRSDSYADQAGKAAALRAITAVQLSPQSIERILSLSDIGWDRAAGEIQTVLDRAMREEIRESTLADGRRKVLAWIRLDLVDEDAAVVREVVQALIVPNSFFNAERTEEMRQAARQRVEPATTTVARNEIILRAGDIVTALDVEALQALGLQQETWNWRDAGAAGALMLLLGVVYLYYLRREELQVWQDRQQPFILFGTFLMFLAVARWAVPAHTVLPFTFPYAALAMMLGVLLNPRLALITTGWFLLLVGWLSRGSLELMVYAAAGSVVGALRLRRGDRFSSFAWSSAYVVGACLSTVAVFRLVTGDADLRGMAELSAASAANGLATAAVTLLGVYLVGILFGIPTPLQLIELSRPTHPLLRQLLLKAPGTYHHTLMISNMVERAAEAVHADALLARVGAYYHDVGKMMRPYFFTENRLEGEDPHAKLDPYTSAHIIIGHVEDGIVLARKYHLPRRLIDFIPEHHGTSLVSYFYHEAVQQAGSAELVDKADFMYGGPKPQSRETGIIMLADGVEATVRAKRPANMEELNKVISASVQSRIAAGQLDDCPLTLQDIQIIKQAFSDVLRGLHHPRILYPPEPGTLETVQVAEPRMEEADVARPGL